MMATLLRIKTNRARNCWEEQNWLQNGDFHTAVSHCQLTELPGQLGSSSRLEVGQMNSLCIVVTLSLASLTN